jgi:hypothetical protein
MVVTQTVSLRRPDEHQLLRYRPRKPPVWLRSNRKLTVCFTSECETSLELNSPIAGGLINPTRTESPGRRV